MTGPRSARVPAGPLCPPKYEVYTAGRTRGYIIISRRQVAIFFPIDTLYIVCAYVCARVYYRQRPRQTVKLPL